MKTYIALFASLTALGWTALSAADAEKVSPVQVNFPGIENYTDFKTDSFNRETGQEGLQHEFTKHLEKLAASRLAPGQRLEVTFSDIDLAGDFEPWRGAQFNDIRVVKDLYPPRMSFAFRLLDAKGQVLSEGKRELKDLGFMMQNPLPNSDNLRYDKELLTGWMRTEFAPKK